MVRQAPRALDAGAMTVPLPSDAPVAAVAASQSLDFPSTRRQSAGVDRINALSNTRVALPVDSCHFTGTNVGFEWTKVADAGFASLQRDFVVAGR